MATNPLGVDFDRETLSRALVMSSDLVENCLGLQSLVTRNGSVPFRQEIRSLAVFWSDEK